MTPLPLRALTLTLAAFGEELDRNGNLRVLHSLRVGLAGKTDEEMAVGFLHDILEDTPLDAAFLRESGIPDDVVAAVETVTRRRDETYREFIERVAAGPVLAIRVKLADLADNLARADRASLSTRYLAARERLVAVLRERG